MAGKFLTLEEAARHLGVTIEEINRLVDRKQLFPMRDGATVKFKIDEIERVAADRGDEAGEGSGLALDLSSPSLGGPASGIGGADDALTLDDDLQLGDVDDEGDSIFGEQRSQAESGSGTVVGGGAGPLDGGSALASSDLDFDSIIAASSPSLPKPAAADSGVVAGSGTLAIDLSNLGSGPAAGSGLGLSGPALSDPLGTSGISLEGDDLAASGIDLSAPGLGGGSGIGGSVIGSGIRGSGIGGSGNLGGDAFELGADGGDDDSASVVIGTDEAGDSSLFGLATEDPSESISMTDGSFSQSVAPGEDFLDAAGGQGFNALQITGLVCTALLLLTCCLVMLDLVWTIPAPGGKPVSSPLLKALTDTFAWK
jgi:hypothetical protein